MMKCVASGIAAGALVVSAASADVTYTFEQETWAGTQFSNLTDILGGFTGTLTGVSINVTLDASTNFAYASDLCIFVGADPLSGSGLLEVGSPFSFLGAAERLQWSNGADSTPGTTVIDSQTLATPLTFTGGAADPIVWLGNSYGDGVSGTWTGSITLIGINAVPAPGTIALLGLAGLAGRRRR